MIAYPPLPQSPTIEPVDVIGRSSQLRKLLQLTAAFFNAWFLLRLRFPRLQRAERLQEIQGWASRVLRILEIEVHCNQGPDANFAGLVVSNHLSWLDILVIQSLLPGVFVAKSEVRHWPLIGTMARACETIFVDRASARSAHAMVDSSVAAFAQGYSVVAFPEGTSSDGLDVGNFHANIFEAAIRTRTPVQTLSLQYVDAASGQPNQAAHFTGDTTLLSSLRKVLARSNIKTQVHVGERIPTVGHSRRSLSHHAHRTIRTQLRSRPQNQSSDY
jgi:1-acyl-sn-glycerol-3-phosphate acyltransferase